MWINAVTMKPGRHVLALFTLLALAGCNQGNAAHAAIPGTGAVATGNYVLVTQRRPESPEKFFARQRNMHALCVQVATRRGITPKPFPAVPDDFVQTRNTYASDGRRIVMREVLYALDFLPGQAGDACAMRLSSSTNMSILANGQLQSTHVDEDGAVHTDEPQPIVAEAVNPMFMAPYKVGKIVNRVPLKCDGASICIIDPAVALVAEGSYPVQASSRIDDVATYGTALILEPVSLSVGAAVDPALFLLGNRK